MEKIKKYCITEKQKKTDFCKRQELEKKAVEGAKKAIKEYRRVFDRLSEYDRT